MKHQYLKTLITPSDPTHVKLLHNNFHVNAIFTLATLLRNPFVFLFCTDFEVNGAFANKEKKPYYSLFVVVL